jgi:hypothetical protein
MLGELCNKSEVDDFDGRIRTQFSQGPVAVALA